MFGYSLNRYFGLLFSMFAAERLSKAGIRRSRISPNSNKLYLVIQLQFYENITQYLSSFIRKLHLKTLGFFFFWNSFVAYSRLLFSVLDYRKLCVSAHFNGRIGVSPSIQDLDGITVSNCRKSRPPKNIIVHAILSHMISWIDSFTSSIFV